MKNLARLVLLAVALILPTGASAKEGASAPRSAGEMSVPAVETQNPRQASRGTRGEDQRYAAREKSNPDAKTFRGGDTVVITATAAIILLLGLIIIILLV